MAPVRVAADGKFRISGVPSLPAMVVPVGIGSGHYLKEVRYNGIVAANDLIPLEESAMTRFLTVVLDDKPAAVGGTVMDGDKPARQPYVVLKRWPPPDGQVFSTGFRTATGDGKGRFQFAGLPPGEYRMVALRSMDEYIWHAPGALERAMAAAKRIELGPRAVQSVDLKLSELR